MSELSDVKMTFEQYLYSYTKLLQDFTIFHLVQEVKNKNVKIINGGLSRGGVTRFEWGDGDMINQNCLPPKIIFYVNLDT